jgi:bifunctional DNase/RNase
MVEMHLSAVRVDLSTNNPVVLLQEAEGARRTLPIFIGAPEATAIAFALQGVTTSRPMTHDLFKDALVALGVTLERVLITELREGTFYAELHLNGPGGVTVVSSRPSDAIALATRTGAPIFADEELMDAEGVQLADEDDEPVEEDGNPDEIVTQFREFIEGVRPEDFSS